MGILLGIYINLGRARSPCDVEPCKSKQMSSHVFPSFPAKSFLCIGLRMSKLVYP